MTASSDIDILIALKPSNARPALGLFGFSALEQGLAKKLGRPVDLVTEESRSTKTLYRLGAMAGFLSGICIIPGRLLVDTQPEEIVDWLYPFFALFLPAALFFMLIT